MVARGSERAPDALALSSDSSQLAFVGPTEYVVTIADPRTLDEVSCSLEADELMVGSRGIVKGDLPLSALLQTP